jgi:ubiquitin-protein ligase
MYRRSMLNWCFDPDIWETEQTSTNRLKNVTHIVHTTTTITLRPMPFITVPQFASHHQLYDQAEREQALRDYKVTIEYKHLKSHAPGGVYIIPSIDNLRKFYGVIFVRRGPYMNGIFKFTLDLPMKYNDVNTHPTITFTSRVYNPYVDPVTGILDILSMYPRWDPTRHYLVTVLTFVKKIFYAKTFNDAMANIEAKELAQTNPIAFTTNIHLCVTESNTTLYTKGSKDDDDNYINDNAGSSIDTSTLQFAEETLAHRVLRDLLKETVKDPSTISKNVILTLVEKAQNA